MKRFAFLLSLLGAGVLTIGCSSHSPSLASHDPFKTDGDPFQAAAGMSPQSVAPDENLAARPVSPGYVAMNGTTNTSAPGWSTTRSAPPSGTGLTARPQQTAALTQDKVHLTFRAASSLPESQTKVVTQPSAPELTHAIPAIGNSSSRETVAGDPFQETAVRNADFIETEESNVTQLGAEQTRDSSPATLEMPVFAEGEHPFEQGTHGPSESTEWWVQ